MNRLSRHAGVLPAGMVLAALLGAPLAQATDAEVAALKAQLAALEARLAEIEARSAATQTQATETERVVKEEVVKGGATPGTFTLPGTNTSVEISGFVKGDFIYDFHESPGGDLFVPEQITVGEVGAGVDDENRFRAHARQSKLVVRSTTPSAYGPVKSLFEADFFGAGGNELFANSSVFRIRHLYGEIGPFGAGQYWSNFMPVETYPRTIDFQGAAGTTFIRQAQARWTQPFGDHFTVIASLENSEFTGRNDADNNPATALSAFGETTPGSVAGINAGLDVAPDAILTGVYRDDWGLVRSSVVGRRFGDQGGDEGGAFGWGVNLGARYNFGTDTRAMATIAYGDGIGRYIINGIQQDGVIDGQGNYDTINALGFNAQIQHDLTDEITLAVAYGRMDVFDTFGPTDLDTVQTVHATAFWSLTKRVTLGAEAIWGQRQNADGQSDSALRLQSSLQVSF